MESLTEKLKAVIDNRMDEEKKSIENQAKKTAAALLRQLEAEDFRRLSQGAITTCTMQCVDYEKGEGAEIYENVIKETLGEKGINVAELLWTDSVGKVKILIVVLKF